MVDKSNCQSNWKKTERTSLSQIAPVENATAQINNSVNAQEEEKKRLLIIPHQRDKGEHSLDKGEHSVNSMNRQYNRYYKTTSK